MAFKDFNVVVPTFQVEAKHICTPREVRHGCFPAFVFNVHLTKEPVDVSEIKNEPFLSICLNR